MISYKQVRRETCWACLLRLGVCIGLLRFCLGAIRGPPFHLEMLWTSLRCPWPPLLSSCFAE